MFNIFKRLFNRRVNTVRECPECGFKGSPKQFKKVKTMTTTTARIDDRHNSSGTSGNVGSGNIGSGETPAPSNDAPTSGMTGTSGITGDPAPAPTPTPTPTPTPATSDDVPTSGTSGVTGTSGISGS
ncbi:hypothetical protein CMI37_05070 [Candidatus Pacearchaeota archaeon]|nr:hypothetical protein [Candidatus Pacearchaeota archaeon]|tara:strand:+ start:43 stop:423 length:381 start_codon:yes stop_codon:yes gene_type:complete